MQEHRIDGMIQLVVNEWFKIHLANRKPGQYFPFQGDSHIIVLLLRVTSRPCMVRAVSAKLNRDDNVLLLDVLELAEVTETLVLR